VRFSPRSTNVDNVLLKSPVCYKSADDECCYKQGGF